MLSGKRFRLKAPTLGIEPADGDVRMGPPRTAVQVPDGEIITVLSGPRPDDKRLVDVLWGEKKLVMFYEDIQQRGELVQGGAA